MTNGTPVDVLSTVSNGGGSDSAEAMASGGALVGFESSTIPQYGFNWQFVDYPFTRNDASFDDHLDVVSDVEPGYAVAPDVEDDIPLSDAVNWGDQLLDHADVVIIVPKENAHPGDVPDRFRVGYTAQPKWGSNAPWGLRDYRDAGDIHLLGGSPSKHSRLARYDVLVRSVDTASPLKAAQFGDVWTVRGWTERPKLTYYERIESSYSNIIDAWNDDRDPAAIRSDQQHGIDDFGP